MGECCAHPGVESVRSCTACGREYCSACFLTPEDQVCRSCRSQIASSVGNQQAPTTSTTAILAFIFSIVGFVSCWCCFGAFHVVSLILAIVAKNEYKKNPGMQGEGLATAAFWLSIAGLVLLALALIAYFVLICLGVIADTFWSKG